MTPEDAAQQHADQDRWLSNALQVSQAEIAMRRDLYVRAFLAGWHAALAAAPASSPESDAESGHRRPVDISGADYDGD